MCCRGPSGCARIDRNSTGRPVNTRLQPIRRVLIARLRVLRRRLQNIWRPEARSRQPGADCTGHTGQTFRRPSGTRQRAALWRWLVCNLSGSHVSRRVVSASASSSPSRVRTLPIRDRVAKPLPLSLAEFLVVPLGLAVWSFALNGFPLRLARSAFSGAPLDGRGRKFNSPARAAELMRAEPRSEDAARRRTSTP